METVGRIAGAGRQVGAVHGLDRGDVVNHRRLGCLVISAGRPVHISPCAVLVVARIVVARMAEADSMSDFMRDRGLAVTAVAEVEIVALVLVDEDVALNLLLSAMLALIERRKGRSLARTGVRVHEADVRGAAAILLDKMG